MSSGNRSGLSPLTKAILWLGIPTLLGIVYHASPLTAALSLVAIFAPALTCWYLFPDVLSDSCILAFFAAGTVGLAAVAVLQAVICYIFATILFGDQTEEYYLEFGRTSVDELSDTELQKRASMASDWHYLLFLPLFTFIAVASVEELLKYTITHYASQSANEKANRDYYEHAIATTLGFSVFENIAYIYAARDEDPIMLGLIVMERIVIAMPAHALSGCLIATKIMLRDHRKMNLSLWQVLAAPIFYHGIFDLCLFAVSAANGNVGWIHPKDPLSIAISLALAVTVLLAAWKHLQYERKKLRPQPVTEDWCGTKD